MRHEVLELPRDTEHHEVSCDRLQIRQNKLTGFIDRKPVLIAWAKRTVQKRF